MTGSLEPSYPQPPLLLPTPAPRASTAPQAVPFSLTDLPRLRVDYSRTPSLKNLGPEGG